MVKVLELKTVSDFRGNLSVVESVPGQLPFDVKRTFWLYKCTGSRGAHRHKTTYMAIVALSGSCKVRVYESATATAQDFELSAPSTCLVMRPTDWHELSDFSADSVVVVFCSTTYSPNDYVMDKASAEDVAAVVAAEAAAANGPSAKKAKTAAAAAAAATTTTTAGAAITSVPFFDLTRIIAGDRDELRAAADRVLDVGRVVLGTEVRAFEEELAKYTFGNDATCFGVGVNSGTDALQLAVRALGIGGHVDGGAFTDEVITVANAGSPTPSAIAAAGAVPVFVDVDAATLQLDAAALRRAITPRTRAVIVIHLYGAMAAIDDVLAVARAHQLRVIEDCAQALGSAHADGRRRVGAIGDIGCFSFYVTKNLGALGDGGACVTRDTALADRLRALRQYGWQDATRSSVLRGGINSRLDELQAAFLRFFLRRFDAALAARRRLAARYAAQLADVPCVRMYGAPAHDAHRSYHLLIVRVVDGDGDGGGGGARDALLKRLQAKKIGAAIHYEVAAHRMPAFRADVALPNTDAACASVLSLPLFPTMRDEEVDYVCQVLKGE